MMMASSSSSVIKEEIETQSQSPLQIPDSPAPRGYLANPYKAIADTAHDMLDTYLAPIQDSHWQNAILSDGVAILPSMRDLDQKSNIPSVKGKSFIPNCRPIEVLACIHLFSYRLIWDVRMSSGRILQRYDYHNFLFYCVWRGIGPIYSPRDAVGVQDIRCWGPQGERQALALPNTQKIQIVWRSCVAPEAPIQEGKVRMDIQLGGYRIEWRPELNGCDVTFVGEANIMANVPTYLYKVLSMELPKVIGRLSGAMQRFGVPPYVLDLQDCVVIQTTFWHGETRSSKHRHHVRKPGSYSIMIDRQRMFPFGIAQPVVTGLGAHAVSLHEAEDRIIVDVSALGVGQEYIIEVEPREKESDMNPSAGWW